MPPESVKTKSKATQEHENTKSNACVLSPVHLQGIRERTILLR
jgi:hypothetical protein